MPPAGKGWYNLNETNYETYCFSKLRRLLTLTRYMMEDTLRGLVIDNHLKFLTFVRGICSAQVQIQSLVPFSLHWFTASLTYLLKSAAYMCPNPVHNSISPTLLGSADSDI